MRQIVGSYGQRVALLLLLGVVVLLSGCLSPNQLPTAAFTFAPSAAVTGSPVSFDASPSDDADGTIVQYAWDLGDGGSGGNTPLTHAYAAVGTYTVTLTVTDDDGATHSASSDIVVTAPQPGNQPPTAAFTFTPSAPVAGSPVSFNASSSTDPDGAIVQYTWSFGDGGSGSGAAPSHAYTTAGSYTATLTVVDNTGASDSSSLGVAVTAGTAQPGNQPPTAAFTPSAVRPAAGTEISFDASASADSDGTIVQYAWDFGDGGTGSGVNTTHVFQNATSDQIIPYTVTLTVTDNDGATDSASVEIDVTPGLPPAP